MHCQLKVSRQRQDFIVRSSDELREVLSSTDSRGGGEFWLSSPDQEFPCLAIRTTAGQADVHYFSAEEHQVFRRMADHPSQSDLLFQFEGCDPYDGELAPGKFVVPLVEALAIADHFMQEEGMYEPSKWFEL
jgi:hypothetical protein